MKYLREFFSSWKEERVESKKKKKIYLINLIEMFLDTRKPTDFKILWKLGTQVSPTYSFDTMDIGQSLSLVAYISRKQSY